MEKVQQWIGQDPLDTDLDLLEEDARDLPIGMIMRIVVGLLLLDMMAIIVVDTHQSTIGIILKGIITATRMSIDIVNGSILTGKVSPGKGESVILEWTLFGNEILGWKHPGTIEQEMCQGIQEKHQGILEI
jgi:hypothetical protein